jgi:ribosome-associated heat shock protein Hsp15
MESVRIDKYLWAVRIFKTRNQATEACKAGKIKIDGQSVKASREIRIDDIITIQVNPILKTIKVVGILHNRVAAKLLEPYMQDLTPPEEYEKLKLRKELNTEFRPKGIGRPTKKERRNIDRLKNFKHLD